MTVSFTIVGPPRTKNTGKVAIARGKIAVFPSGPYRRWYASALRQKPFVMVACRKAGVRTPISGRVEVTAIFYRDRASGDEDRYKVGLGDYLERAGVIENDRQIHWGGGCRLDKDAARPRVEVTITTEERA